MAEPTFTPTPEAFARQQAMAVALDEAYALAVERKRAPLDATETRQVRLDTAIIIGTYQAEYRRLIEATKPKETVAEFDRVLVDGQDISEFVVEMVLHPLGRLVPSGSSRKPCDCGRLGCRGPSSRSRENYYIEHGVR